MKAKSRALVVDDHDTFRDTIKHVFRQAGWEVPTFVADGEHALEILKESPDAHQVIILDQRLPLMTGLETLREAKTQRIKLPPVIMVTANNDASLAPRAKELGVLNVLLKGNSSYVKELKRLLNKICHSPYDKTTQNTPG